MRYIKQLDGVRAIAVCLVLIWHWVPRTYTFNEFPNGPFGVNIFFVLSGFLITQILLSNRLKADAAGLDQRTVWKNFYIRRTLRIFPIYYLSILLVLLLVGYLKIPTSENEIIAAATYTSNFYNFFTRSFPTATPHLWSLAVEEQFYLLWPVLMLFLPYRYLLHCIIFFILIAIASQWIFADTGYAAVLPSSCFNCLAMGAGLAWFTEFKPDLLGKLYRYLSVAALLGFGVIVFELFVYRLFSSPRFFHGVIGAWLICFILIHANSKNRVMSFFGNRFLVFVGKLSYGIYLYHILYYYLAVDLWTKYVYPHVSNIESTTQTWIFFILNFWILLGFCWLSWKYIESPILRLKSRFRYQRNPDETTVAPPKETVYARTT